MNLISKSKSSNLRIIHITKSTLPGKHKTINQNSDYITTILLSFFLEAVKMVSLTH